MAWILMCGEGDFYFDDLEEAIAYGEENCPTGYDLTEIHD